MKKDNQGVSRRDFLRRMGLGAGVAVASIVLDPLETFADPGKRKKKSAEGEKGINTIESVVKTYFKEGGQHIQINVVDDATLRAAQENPEEYRGLVVRVAGYLAYFTELDRHVQDSIIARTAHSGC